MQTLKLTDDNARKLYKTAPSEMKAILEDSFTKEFFSQKITDRIKNYEDACNDQGLDPDEGVLTDDERAINNQIKLRIVIRSLNEGWKPDWNNSSERKWYPWFYMDSPGFRFHGSYYGYSRTTFPGGSRLYLRSQELSDYAAKQFFDLYKGMML